MSHGHAHFTATYCFAGPGQALIGWLLRFAWHLPIRCQLCVRCQVWVPACHCKGKCQTKCEEWAPIRTKMLAEISLAVHHPSWTWLCSPLRHLTYKLFCAENTGKRLKAAHSQNIQKVFKTAFFLSRLKCRDYQLLGSITGCLIFKLLYCVVYDVLAMALPSHTVLVKKGLQNTNKGAVW